MYDEPHWRNHLNQFHHETSIFVQLFADEFNRLPNLDMSLFGDIRERLDLDIYLGTMKEQLTRIAKLLALRKVVKHSKLHSKVDLEAKPDK